MMWRYGFLFLLNLSVFAFAVGATQATGSLITYYHKYALIRYTELVQA
jgi:hypothetical protein